MKNNKQKCIKCGNTEHSKGETHRFTTDINKKQIIARLTLTGLPTFGVKDIRRLRKWIKALEKEFVTLTKKDLKNYTKVFRATLYK